METFMNNNSRQPGGQMSASFLQIWREKLRIFPKNRKNDFLKLELLLQIFLGRRIGDEKVERRSNLSWSQTDGTMNYIFGNNTLYPRSSRVGGASGGQGAGLGIKQKLGPKRGSSEELAPPHTSSPSTSSPASSSPSTSSSRWQQLLTFFSRRSAFTDCINSSQVMWRSRRVWGLVCVCDGC